MNNYDDMKLMLPCRHKLYDDDMLHIKKQLYKYKTNNLTRVFVRIPLSILDDLNIFDQDYVCLAIDDKRGTILLSKVLNPMNGFKLRIKNTHGLLVICKDVAIIPISKNFNQYSYLIDKNKIIVNISL